MMKVTDIDIRDLHWDQSGACFRAAVNMMMVPDSDDQPRRVNFICQSHRAQDCPSSLITYDMVTHALEQARAMPGFRRGEEAISVDLGATIARLPVPARKAG